MSARASPSEGLFWFSIVETQNITYSSQSDENMHVFGRGRVSCLALFSGMIIVIYVKEYVIYKRVEGVNVIVLN